MFNKILDITTNYIIIELQKCKLKLFLRRSLHKIQPSLTGQRFFSFHAKFPRSTLIFFYSLYCSRNELFVEVVMFSKICNPFLIEAFCQVSNRHLII